MTKRELRVGFDFDGVIAYSPTRLLRAPISFIKRKILKKKGVSFFVPKNKWHKIVWAIIFGPSVFAEKGTYLIKEYAISHDLYLITGRFDFLEISMMKWLKKYDLEKCFKNIFVNRDKKQPHEFKKVLINKLRLDYFVEDNWDAVEFLDMNCPKTKILWIYNIVDRNISYKYKFPHLESALNYVKKENSI